MGNNGNKGSTSKEKEESKTYLTLVSLSKNHFDFLYVVGRGGFGKVERKIT
jgi:hypothetical protein